MKLFYKPGACSLSPHIVLYEMGLDFSAQRVDLVSKKTETGEDFLKINPKGQVPALLLDDGNLLTEGVAIIQYLGDKKPDRNMIAPVGTLLRYRALEWLNYIATELHKGFSPLFNPATPEEYKEIARQRLTKQFEYLNTVLANSTWLVGEHFNVADAYLFTIMRWPKAFAFNLTPYNHLTAYLQRVASRKAVSDALAAEGLT